MSYQRDSQYPAKNVENLLILRRGKQQTSALGHISVAQASYQLFMLGEQLEQLVSINLRHIRVFKTQRDCLVHKSEAMLAIRRNL